MHAEWESGPERPQIALDVVDVWRADLAAGGDDLHGSLSEQERERASRFVRTEDGMRWGYARAILRTVLARYTDADPRALRFAEGAHGKPELAGTGADALAGRATAGHLRFNLSHSGDTALIAVALHREVGVDVELPRRATDHVAIARRILGDEEAERLAALDEPTREREFLRAWVRWEAVLKCWGTGIGGADDPPTGPDPWVVELDVGSPAAAALAVEDGPCTVRCWQWPAVGA
ncbi:MAG TPA: 4'-phosphopantetheinyl transferase superfamily protein [Conexibacter sp.]|nr:4'-phosphopantetheinyl transferase superfamily protein [Conexibacter sp.]